MKKRIEVSTQAEFDKVCADGNIAIVSLGRWMAWGNSSVVAWGNSSVVAWGNSSVVAKENVFVRLYAALRITASATVVIMMHGQAQTLTGGIQIEVAPIKNGQDWCDFYGIEVTDGVAVLYKALEPNFNSPHGTNYAPGTMPTAPDWDWGKVECGGGLHFSPSPRHALSFHSSAKKFAGCPVRVEDIAVHPKGSYPEKVKAPGVCAPCFEVDRNGKRVG